MRKETYKIRKNYYSEYCTGCGLCENAENVRFTNHYGFPFPAELTEKQVVFCEKVCPVNGINYNRRTDNKLWGPECGVYKGWSLDDEIRYKAASGGIITALSCFLVESRECDGIIQIGVSKSNACELQLYVNTDRNKIIECSSSRYITGITYRKLFQLIDYNKKYAVIGKPCDIEALINYMDRNIELRKCIKYTVTFFCAGAPSRNATINLSKELGIQENEIRSVRYRGNGWPGKATIVSKRGFQNSMEYIESWNKILGRDIRKMCKFCVNGTGMFADISCGDLWNLDEKHNPTFSEDKGQNIVFARSSAGQKLLKRAQEKGYIYLENYTEMEKLKYVQPNHFNMQTTMIGKIVGLKIGGCMVPQYSIKKLSQASKGISKAKLVRTAMGTIKRIIKGSI